MDFLPQITWADLLVVLILALGALAGWTEGMVRSLLACVAVIVAFVLASLVKDSVFELLSGVWDLGTRSFRELLIFLVVFVVLLVGLLLVIRAVVRPSRLALGRAVDEVGGGLVGIVFAAMVIVFTLLVLDSFYRTVDAVEAAQWAPLRDFYTALNGSPLVQPLRNAVVATAGLLAQPFVPEDVRRVLQPG